MKKDLVERAVNLRKEGLSYSQILAEIPVAKSTLSLWLQSVGLSKRQKQKLTEKKRLAALRGAATQHIKTTLLREKIYAEAKQDIQQISEKEFWLMGVMLYWAEGSKEKEKRPGSGVQFTNSEPEMIKLFLRWLIVICKVKKEDIYFDLFIHDNHKYRLNTVIRHWEHITRFPEKTFSHVYFKRSKPKTKRTNIGDSYFGVIKIRVKASSALTRKIAGWTKGVIQYFQ